MDLRKMNRKSRWRLQISDDLKISTAAFDKGDERVLVRVISVMLSLIMMPTLRLTPLHLKNSQIKMDGLTNMMMGSIWLHWRWKINPFICTWRINNRFINPIITWLNLKDNFISFLKLPAAWDNHAFYFQKRSIKCICCVNVSLSLMLLAVF